MLQVARWRVVMVLVATALGLLFALPNVLPQSVLRTMPDFIRGSTMNLGLDLQGGSHLLLEADTEALKRQRLEQIVDDMADTLRNAEPRIFASGRGVRDDAAQIRVRDPEQVQRALDLMQQNIVASIQTNGLGQSVQNVTLTTGPDGLIEGRISDEAMRQLARESIRQSIEVIRRRIDPNGVSEVTIVAQGDDRIVVQAPGMTDPEQLRQRIGRTALLTFHMVVDGVTQEDIESGRLPSNAQVLPLKDGAGAVVIERRPRITGESLSNATATFDERNQPAVAFQFSGRGSNVFCTLTTQNVGKPFAIVLDNVVLTAPNIQEPICGGRGQITGSFTTQETQELSLMLRAGALPVPLRIMEERTVSAELGKDAIDNGAMSGVIAGVATLVFMVLAYGLFGVFACVALVVNGILVVAAMSLIGAALTLPGIAGLILTIAMAVDANVLIYERMREEQAAGRGPALAIDAGFSRAIVTIIDANLTTILAALILFWFGVGPVRGFAWTLSIGVITSVFTAVFITQILVALWFRVTRPKRLPI